MFEYKLADVNRRYQSLLEAFEMAEQFIQAYPQCVCMFSKADIASWAMTAFLDMDQKFLLRNSGVDWRLQGRGLDSDRHLLETWEAMNVGSYPVRVLFRGEEVVGDKVDGCSVTAYTYTSYAISCDR
jgi:hypothetical protein